MTLAALIDCVQRERVAQSVTGLARGNAWHRELHWLGRIEEILTTGDAGKRARNGLCDCK